MHYHTINTEVFQAVHEDEHVTVYSIPLDHRILCAGFLFEEKKKNRRIIKERLPKDFSIRNIVRLKHGEDILDEEGKLLFAIKN